jgi:hypothetical protein
MCNSQVEIQLNVWFSAWDSVECVVLRLGFILMCGSCFDIRRQTHLAKACNLYG